MNADGPAFLAELMYGTCCAPWDIGGPQPVIRQLAALGAVRGAVLDPGCGTGWHAIEYARAGCSVTGIDLAPTAIARARTNARTAGVEAQFVLGDATTLDYEARFDTVVDSKLLDNLDSAEVRGRYLRSLYRAMNPGGRLFLYGFGTGHVNGFHNHELDGIDYEMALTAAGLTINYLGETTYRLSIPSYRRICTDCPNQVPPDSQIHIPMIEIHAVRNDLWQA
ncbi:thiopurine S-methyltransferase (tpmt) superfamily protein [Mycobacteroides abscessus subsp. abscessus]|uniref:class I SAM-dependent methyltransferase n=1 Tax=Mycobacteroides abscessus TaxID=36809 RepID=UPI000927BF83|nr:class I SAM-dependent methyltransferase [Mycobacteroides abscessus]SHW35292.1 thiopurine S-methyltransferase (tpmt) superfamily protein [Mycobacteroides abscessus subsp. abscessus]SHY08156.1 thiopurine S-methyltransferase (tpmt) superfamily protein [Mycobacteroides abscessus subsp. abscessus]SIC59329.1 thiopurine S-methyltransferase (tpmt) superfamily protein [Mycobacteroides abscessus subsp. abscessus]SKW33358.1 thiopurine S-methyltransferase (tpmt) superfamily protein [Mycobacteroides absc